MYDPRVSSWFCRFWFVLVVVSVRSAAFFIFRVSCCFHLGSLSFLSCAIRIVRSWRPVGHAGVGYFLSLFHFRFLGAFPLFPLFLFGFLRISMGWWFVFPASPFPVARVARGWMFAFAGFVFFGCVSASCSCILCHFITLRFSFGVVMLRCRIVHIDGCYVVATGLICRCVEGAIALLYSLWRCVEFSLFAKCLRYVACAFSKCV